jgi:hypothetical protein
MKRSGIFENTSECSREGGEGAICHFPFAICHLSFVKHFGLPKKWQMENDKWKMENDKWLLPHKPPLPAQL